MRTTPLRRGMPLHRRLYRPPPRPESDKVGPELRLAVLRRDDGCAAPRAGGSAADCWGRLLLDHIKDAPRMGVRAESDMDHLVTLCQGHSEDGRKAGFQWNTANRPALRDYLDRVNGTP